MNIEGKTIFINTLKRKMVEAIKEIMPCNFHVEINEITETDNVDSYHGETTFVISHKTPFGKPGLEEVCLNGQAFAVIVGSFGSTMVQIYEAVDNMGGIPQPKRCEIE